jgi:glycosyltransferase involved in cell wall biosynthesis
MQRVLLITDLPAGASESAVEGVFRGELRRHFAVDIVFHDPALRQAVRRDDALVVPKRALRGGVAKALRGLADPAGYDYVIVRNKYYLLRAILAEPRSGRVGFWETFPHSYRRLADAEQERRAVWRKGIEYAWRRWTEARLLRRADFFLPITARHREEFHPGIRVPSSPLPMGVDEALFRPWPEAGSAGPLRLVYIGTVDRLRRVDELNAVFRGTDGEFQVDYYTFSRNETVEVLRRSGDPRIRVLPALPRPALLEALRAADVGVGYVPPVRTYIGSSPTKTLEYAALGLTVLANPLPDYADWLDERAAVLTAFEPAAIREGLRRLLATPRAVLVERARAGAQRALAKRSYRVLAAELASFLNRL